MFYLVFSKEDKEKALLMGATLISEQKSGNDIIYLMTSNNVNFESNGINCVKTNNINF